jgi:hemolysin activation/secretion protein
MNYFKTKIIYILVFWACFTSTGIGQKDYSLLINVDEEEQKTISKFAYQTNFSDSLSIYLEIKSLLNKCRSASFLEASADKITFEDSICKVDFHLGPRYEIAKISAGNIDPIFLDEIGFRESNIKNKPLTAEIISNLMSDILEVFENSGYPFAQSSLKNLTIEDGILNAELHVDKGKLFLFDDFNLTGDAQISQSYLQMYLDIRASKPYDQSKVLKVRDIIRSNPFLQLKDNPTITFQADKAKMNLNLTKKKASRFDFLIGILPQNKNGETNITITGELTADMYNKLGRGEHFFLEFKRLRPETQELELAFNYPFLLDLPFGIDTKFELFRNANDFLEIDFNTGLQYLFTGVDYLKFFVNFNSIRLLDIDTTQIKALGRLPNQLDINYNSGGLELTMEKLDYKFNPRKGFYSKLSGAVGFKKVVRNNQILEISSSDVDFSILYDSLKQQSFQFNVLADISYFIPLMKRATILTRFRGGFKISGEEVFENELHRLGGNKLLRGFDEESVLAQFYSVFSLEYRLLISQNSYISAFFDYGLVKNSFREEKIWDNPYGFGAGINFETSAGIFGLSAALGSQLDNPINFRDIKVHFGYVSLF